VLYWKQKEERDEISKNHSGSVCSARRVDLRRQWGTRRKTHGHGAGSEHHVALDGIHAHGDSHLVAAARKEE